MKRLLFLLPAFLAFQVSASPALAWTWPADGPVLRHFQFGSDPYASGQHRGIDVEARDGANVLAPTSGLVTFGGTVPSGGRTLTIETASGYAVTLLHLGAISARKGESVVEGAVIGTAGRSGVPEHDAVYIHLGVRLGADRHGYLDPLSLLPPRTSEAPPVSVTNEHVAGSQSSASVGDESEGREGASISPIEGASAEPEPAEGSSASPPVQVATAHSPSPVVPAVAAGVLTAAPTAHESDVAISESTPADQPELPDTLSVEELQTKEFPKARPSNSPSEPSPDPVESIAVASPETSAVSSDHEAQPLATDIPGVDLAISPQTLAELGLSAGESQAIQALTSSETTAAPISAEPSSPVETVTVLIPAADAQSGSAPSISEADVPATNDSVDADFSTESATHDGATPSSRAEERPASLPHVDQSSNVEGESPGHADSIASPESPTGSSASAARVNSSSSPAADRAGHLGLVASPVAPVARPTTSDSSGGSRLGMLGDDRPARLVDPSASATTARSVAPASRSQMTEPDAGGVQEQASSQRHIAELITAALVLGLSSAAAAALVLFRRREGPAGTTRPLESVPVAPTQGSEPSLPELSESDRTALDAELEEILVSPEPDAPSPRRSEVTVRV